MVSNPLNNQHLEQYAQSILSRYKHLFDEVDRICNELLMNTDVNDVTRYYEYQDRLTGIYGALNVAYKDIKAKQKNEEVRYYHQLKILAASNNEKFISASAEKEADLYVAPLRTARDILEGYVEVVVTAIGTCRSRIYEYQKDKKYDI